jgi:hypothetical protein
LVAQRVADGRVLTLIERMLTAGYMQHGHLFPTPQGTPQGGVVSPLLRGCLKTCQTSEATHHEMDHRDTDHRVTRVGEIFIILR